MSERSKAFTQGGCGCLIAFGVGALLAVIMGGSVHIDPGGAILLFVMGGVIGLVVLSIHKRGYEKGRRDHGADDREWLG